MPSHEEAYVALRNAVLARHFALGRFWRANHFTNVNVLGEAAASEFAVDAAPIRRRCGTPACVPRRAGSPAYTEVVDPHGRPGHGADSGFPNLANLPDVERWRVWYRDRTNALMMSGLRSLQLCVEHRLGQPLARRIVKLMLRTLGTLFKWPADSAFGGYVLRWDPATDDLWELSIDRKGHATPVLPCHWPLNSQLDGKDTSFHSQRYVYCISLRDPRYDAANSDHFRRYEPSKDEYLGLVTAYLTIFNTFVDDPSPEAAEIIAMVRTQTRRVARYLQHWGYLIVRPAGGVTIRGAGELLPLFEIPFNRAFKRILGQEFKTKFQGGLSAYQRAFNHALGLNPWPPVAPAVEYHDALASGEALAGLAFGNLPRPVRAAAFDVWMRNNPTTATTAIADGFKPYVALLLLGTEADAAQRHYLDSYLNWYSTLFDPAPLAPTPDLVDGRYDWTLAMAVGLLVADHLNRTDWRRMVAGRLERDLNAMKHQLERLSALSGAAGVQPIAVSQGSSAGFTGNTEGDHCALHPAHLASECHDKQGNWTGYLAPLALVWQYLTDGRPNEFTALTVPARDSVRSWPVPVVPAAPIRAAHVDRMPIPLSAIATTPPPANTPDVPLFDEPSPPKPDDNTLGTPPAPQGHVIALEFEGGILPTRIRETHPYPALVAPAGEASFWKPVPAFNAEEITLVRDHRFWFEDGQLHIDLHLRAVRLNADGTATRARLRGTYSLAWVWSAW